MTFDQILGELQKGKYQPLYFLHGEEPFFIDAVADFIEKNALNETEKAFNQSVLYGKDSDHLSVVDIARRYPMMAERQVLIIKEAQDMKSLAQLQSYVEKPMPSTVLVICHKHKKYNLNTAFGKAVKASAVVLESKPLYDNQVPDWIKSYLKGRQIQQAATELIAEYLGTDLSKIANELDKLLLNVPAGTPITTRHIEENIGISKEYNIFELQKALSQRDVLKANRIVQYFAANPKKNPLQVVISSLYGYFSKIYQLHFVKDLPENELITALQLRSAFFLKEYKLAARAFPLVKTEQIIGLLRIYDLKSKGVDYDATGKPEGELLRELVWLILH